MIPSYILNPTLYTQISVATAHHQILYLQKMGNITENHKWIQWWVAQFQWVHSHGVSFATISFGYLESTRIQVVLVLVVWGWGARCKRSAVVPEFMLQGSVYLEGGGEVIEEETHTSCRGQSLLFLQFFLPATPVCFFPSSSFSWMPSPQALLLSLVILRRLFSPHPPICAGCLFSRSLLSYPSL